LTQEHRNAVARTAKSDMRRAVRVRIAAMTRQERDLADAAVCSHLVDLVLEVGSTPSFRTSVAAACVFSSRR
jgi:hypothetical protein